MSETTTVDTSTVEQAPKENLLKRYAKAFYAKASKTAQAVKALVVRTLGDNETAIDEMEGKFRKALRYVAAVPKWIGHGIVFLAQTLLFAAFVVVLGLVIALAAIVSAVLGAAWIMAMIAFKIIQGVALLVRTPYLAVRGDDCLVTDYAGYALLWKPKYFACTRIAQAFYQQAAAEAKKAEALEDAVQRHPAGTEVPRPNLTVVKDDQAPKGRPTNRQHKRRPRRMPTSPVTA